MARHGFALYQELVPLREAAAIAYHVIAEKPIALRKQQRLVEVRGLVAIALSSVGTVLKQEGDVLAPLSPSEIDQRLSVRDGQPRLEGLCMRRAELLRAIEILKDAHVAFDPDPLRDALRRGNT